MNIFWGMNILWICFGGSSQNWASFRLITMHFGAFFKVKSSELGYFFGLLKFQIFFLGCLIFLIFFGVNGGPWVRAYVCGKNKSTPLGC